MYIIIIIIIIIIIVLPQNSPIKLNLTQPRPYPRCQSFFVPVVGSEN